MPKYIAGVKAFLAWGRSMTHQATAPSRSKRSPAAPSSSDTRSSFVDRLPGDTTGRPSCASPSSVTIRRDG